MNPFRRFVSFGLSFLLSVGQPAEAIAASYVFRQPSAAGTYPIPTISNNIVTTGTYYKVDGKTYSISWQGSGGLAPYVIEIVSGNLPAGCPKPVQSGSVLSTACVFASEGTWGGVVAQLTDANGMVVRDNAPNIVVTAPPPVLSAYSFPFSGGVGKSYTGSAKITGGRPPYAVSRSSGAIPPGTTLSGVQDGSGNWTATLSGTPTAIGSYTFDILVADVNGKSVTSSQLNVNISYGAVSLALRPSKAAGVYRGVVGQPIKDSGVLVSGGTPPVVLSIQSGGLPPGLSMGQTGAVTGTPTASGSFANIRAKAVDGATTPTTATSAIFSFEIAKALNAFVLGGSDAYTVGKQIAPVSTATTGGTGPYTYALAGSLPPGLTFSNSQGTVSGTPTRSGRYPGLAVTAQDSDGYQSTSQPFAMSVTDPLKITGTAPDGTAGREYSAQFTASGGTAPYSFSIGEGSLPFGIDLGEDGLLSGTPFIGGSSDGIVVRAIDSDGVSAETFPFSIDIRDALAIAAVPTASATRGKPYDARVEASGGVQPYRFTTVTGSFASGLAMDANGRISGTPTVSGNPGAVTVLATDAEGSTASADVTIPVVDPLSVAGTLPPGTVGQAYTTSYSAFGGSPPYSYVLTAGNLPPGLAFDGDAGTITGTPTSSGSWTGIVVGASDIDGRTASSSPATLAVSGQLQIAGTPSRTATVGQNYSASFAAMGGKSPYAFSVAAGTLPSGIVLNGATGTLSGSPTAKATSEGLQVRVVDAEGRTATSTTFGIAVSDVLTLSGAAPATATVNAVYSGQFAVQGGRAPYAWRVGAGTLPPGLSIDQNGAVAGTPTTPGNYANIQVAATDADGRQASSAPFSIAVASSLAVTGTPTAFATTGTAYDALFTAQGGYGAKTFALTAGTLPQGIVLDANTGTLSGTPTAIGTASGLKVRATDSVGATADSSVFSIDVRGPVTIASLPSGISAVGAAYSSSASATGGRSPYVWVLTAGTLPPGLSLNSSSGTVAGTPTTPGTFAGLRLRATDADGRATTSSPFSIDVTSTLAIAGSPTPNATVGIAYSASFTSSGGSGAKSFAIASGTLPNGLTLSSAGALSGTPTVGGQFAGLVVRVVDASGTTADSSAFSIDVRDGVAVVGLPTGSASVGTTYSSSATANGGRSPYGWSLASGTLPPGLSLGGTSGALTGTPTTPGAYPGIALRAVDADGRSAVSSAFQIDVANTLVIAGSPASISTVGTPYSATFSSSGGFGARTYSLVGGTLPGGLSLSTAGVLSGTPTTNGTATGLVVRVTDASGTTAASPPFAIDVRDPLSVAALSPSPASVGQAYSVVPAASGGRTPLNWSLYAGSLPPGLSVGNSTGAVAGTPTTPGNYNGLRLQAVDADGRLAVSPAFDIAVSSTLMIAGTPPGFATVDQFYSTTFTSSGGSGTKAYSIAAGALPAGLALASDGTLSGNPSTIGTATGIVIRVVDGVGTNAQTAPFSIDVRSTPVIAGLPAGSAAVGQAYNSSAGATGGRASYGWSLVAGTLPAGLTLDAVTGTVSGTPTTPGTSSNLRIRAVDADGRSATSQLFDIAVASTLAIAGTPASTATVGTGYSAAFTSSGGYGSKTFTLAIGTLPAGIALASNGQLSGTPTTAGTASGLVVRVTDASGTSIASAPFSIDVRAAISVAAVSPAAAFVGQPYAIPLSATGGRAPLSWATASGTLPPGFVLDAAAGSIGGTPTTPGTFTGLRVRATDADGRSAVSSPFDITVASTLAIAGTPSSVATVGALYSASFSSTGGSGAKSFSLSTGVLPSGLSLSTAGVLSGTPNAVGTSAGLVVRVTDASGTTADGSPFSIDVRAALALAGTPTATGTVGTPYSSSITATGGRAPYGWSLATGTLPIGLTLNASNGVIAGTPTTAGTSSGLSLGVTDADGRSTASASFSIAIASSLSVSGSPPATASVGTPYSATFAAAGGSGAKTFSIGSGTLPAGLSLSTVGVLSGTPTAAGTTTGLIVRVADGTGATADSAAFSIDVKPAMTVTVPTRIYQPVGTAFNIVPEVTGGTAPMTASLLTAGEALPTGLSFNTANGAITGTSTQATPGPRTFRVRFTDAAGAAATSDFFYVFSYQPLTITNTLPSPLSVYRPQSINFNFTLAGNGMSPYTYSIDTGALPPGMTLNTSSGAVTGYPTSSGTFSNIRAKVVSSDGYVGYSPTFSVTVTPALTISGTPPATAPLGRGYSAQFTGSGGIGPYSYSLNAGTLPAGLALDTSTGSISGTPTAAGNATGLIVRVTDGQGYGQFSATFSINVPQALGATFAPPSGTVGQPYAASVATTGGVAPYSYQNLGALLPSGLTLNTSTGAVSGTPTGSNDTGGIYFKVTDGSGDSVVTAATTISIRAPVVPTAPSYRTRQNVAYTGTATAVGGKSPYTFVLTGTLPTGLTFNASTGTVSGTPTVAGTVSGLTLTATDSVGRVGSTPVYFETVAPLAVTSGVPTAAADVNKPYSFQFTTSGGRGPTYWGVYGGALPAGIDINRSTGLLSGTATAPWTGTGIDVRARDDDGYEVAAPLFTLYVVDPLTATTPAPAAAAQDTAFQHGLVAGGGRAPFTWSLASGILPSGLSVSNGRIAGTPTVAGSASNILLRVTDAEGRTATTNAFSMTVTPAALTANYAAPTFWPETPGSAYFANSYATVANYYRGTLTWTLGTGSLPPGLTLASNGSMSGNLTTAGSYTATLRATDSDGRTGTTPSFTIVVTTTFTISYSMPTAVVNRSYAAPAPTVSGGRPPFAYSVSSNAGGTLATGLSINASTGVISGTPSDTGNPKNLILYVTDADGRGKGVPINPVVNPAFQANNPGNAFKTVNQAFTWQVGAYGGIGPYTYSIGTGSLPPGMSMNSAGTISGTPTTRGPYTIAVNVRDSQNYTLSTGNFTLTIQ